MSATTCVNMVAARTRVMARAVGGSGSSPASAAGWVRGTRSEARQSLFPWSEARRQESGGPRPVMLSIAAILDGRTATLLARDGRRIGTVALGRIGPVSPPALTRLRWHRAARMMVERLNARLDARQPSAWQRRAEGLAHSFRLRGHDRPYRGGRRHFDRYRTHTWHDAALRLVCQGLERRRVRTRTGWERWAYTASNNSEKRAEAYGYAKTNHRQTSA